MGNCRCLEQKEDEKKEILKEETPETLPGKETQNDMAILETFIKENPKFYNSIIKLQSHYRGIKTREDVRLRCSNRPKKKDEKISDYVSEVKTLPAAEPEKPNPQSKKVQIDTPNDRIKEEELEMVFILYPPLDDGVVVEKKPPLNYENKSCYYGEWDTAKIKRHGRGILVWSDGSKYQGYFKDDKVNVRGKLVHVEGNYYDGEWLNDKVEGYGVYCHADGARYEGNWKNDKQEGHGKEAWKDGSLYEGEYKDGMKNGLGHFKWVDGAEYTGNFENNNINGYGVYFWKDKRCYDGEWVNNKMHGRGKFIWPDGRKYEGEYKNDKKEGEGNFYWPDGKIFIGHWKNGKQDGEGKMYNPKTKEWKSGIWENGRRVKVTDGNNNQREQVAPQVISQGGAQPTGTLPNKTC